MDELPVNQLRTRLLGIDFGVKRVGLAISDPDRRISSPLAVYQRQTTERDSAYFLEVVNDWEIDKLVLGMPLHTSGQSGLKVQQTRSFAGWLAKVTQRPIVFWDERFTTSQAHERLKSAGVRASQRKGRIDSIAAQILLQDYLDEGCPDAMRAATLDDRETT
jgi:putative Holliday junction resolvase